MWNDYENETLIHNHKMAKIYKKRYQRAGDFYNSLYNFFGIITVISSTVASTISWGTDLNDNDNHILSAITTISAITASIQNFYKFQDFSNEYFKTAKIYAKLQNKIESIGNIHPDYRDKNPIIFFKKIQDNFDQISDSRIEISNCMSKYCYNKSNDDSSYLEEKHNKYKGLNDSDKKNYSKNNIKSSIMSDENSSGDSDVEDYED